MIKQQSGIAFFVVFLSVSFFCAELVEPTTADVVMEGEYVTVTVPSVYEERLKEQIPMFDDTYLALRELFGRVPFNGEKIGIKYDSTIEGALALPGNPIVIGKGFWGGAPHPINRS